jgi:hypothetical protein
MRLTEEVKAERKAERKQRRAEAKVQERAEWDAQSQAVRDEINKIEAERRAMLTQTERDAEDLAEAIDLENLRREMDKCRLPWDDLENLRREMDKCRLPCDDLDNGWGKSERLLGVSMDASAEVKRSAYRALAKVHHPDHGGDREKFEAIQKAYEEITA